MKRAVSHLLPYLDEIKRKNLREKGFDETAELNSGRITSFSPSYYFLFI
jgi:hypothetical protein